MELKKIISDMVIQFGNKINKKYGKIQVKNTPRSQNTGKTFTKYLPCRMDLMKWSNKNLIFRDIKSEINPMIIGQQSAPLQED